MNSRTVNSLLHWIASLKPEALDAIIPQGMNVSSASRTYLMATAMKGLRSELGETINVTALIDRR